MERIKETFIALIAIPIFLSAYPLVKHWVFIGDILDGGMRGSLIDKMNYGFHSAWMDATTAHNNPECLCNSYLSEAEKIQWHNLSANKRNEVNGKFEQMIWNGRTPYSAICEQREMRAMVFPETDEKKASDAAQQRKYKQEYDNYYRSSDDD